MTASNDPGGSAKPGKQRKRDAEATHQTRRKKMAAHLDEDLMLEFDRRSMPVREGDTVRIERGDFSGHEGEVLEVNHKRLEVEVDGVTNRRADGTQVPRPLHPSNLTITDLHLTDPQRRAALERKGVEVEAPPEPEPEEEEEAEEEPEPDEIEEPATAPPDAEKGPDRPAPEEPEPDEGEEPDVDEPEAPEDDADEPAPEPDEADEPEPEEEIDREPEPTGSDPEPPAQQDPDAAEQAEGRPDEEKTTEKEGSA